jgi:PIN domain nuclease of toxin-antitoxin system
MLNLDTHILIDIMIGHLTPKEEKLIRNNPWSISSIVLWELHKLNQIGRIEIDLQDREIKKFLNSLVIHQIDLNILNALENLDFKSDPADEIIAATSVYHKIPLMTRDEKIRKSKIVPLAKT